MSSLRIIGTALVLACSVQLAQRAHAAPQPVVVPVMLKDLADMPGKEMLMITVDYPPGAVESHDDRPFQHVNEGVRIVPMDVKEVTLMPGQTFLRRP